MVRMSTVALVLVCLTGCTALRRTAAVPPAAIEPATEIEGETPEVPASPAPEPPEPRSHEVSRGETLTAVARRYGTSVQALVEQNRLEDPDRLQVGQRLVVPGAPAPVAPAPVLVSGMMWPVDGGHVLSPFGAPRGSRSHTGVDIGGRAGQPILASERGVVVFAGTLRGYGSTVVLDHGGGLRSLYAHNRGLLVEEGETVERGEAIAELGRSGNATTDHCHFELRREDVPLDPLTLLSSAGARP
jgi:murein DD-endopeptidase MepM/ murein hydrolase activator NlpD